MALLYQTFEALGKRKSPPLAKGKGGLQGVVIG